MNDKAFLYRELMWINEQEGFIAFDVKNLTDNQHAYFEYIKFFVSEKSLMSQKNESIRR